DAGSNHRSPYGTASRHEPPRSPPCAPEPAPESDRAASSPSPSLESGMDSTQHEKAIRFRALHDAPGVFLIPNPWDTLSARILTGLGFSALATSSAAAAAVQGRRDHGLNREESLAHARAIVNATTLPVSADLGIGFGDKPEAVAETVRQAAAVGLVGCTIEDSTGDAAHPLYDEQLAVERIA